MIAQELVEGKMLGADLGIDEKIPQSQPFHEVIPQSQPFPPREKGVAAFYINEKNLSPLGGKYPKGDRGIQIKSLLQNKNLKIKIVPDVLNVELYGSLKNIMAIMV
jgi:hypothetical protein